MRSSLRFLWHSDECIDLNMCIINECENLNGFCNAVHSFQSPSMGFFRVFYLISFFLHLVLCNDQKEKKNTTTEHQTISYEKNYLRFFFIYLFYRYERKYIVLHIPCRLQLPWVWFYEYLKSFLWLQWINYAHSQVLRAFNNCAIEYWKKKTEKIQYVITLFPFFEVCWAVFVFCFFHFYFHTFFFSVYCHALDFCPTIASMISIGIVLSKEDAKCKCVAAHFETVLSFILFFLFFFFAVYTFLLRIILFAFVCNSRCY